MKHGGRVTMLAALLILLAAASTASAFEYPTTPWNPRWYKCPPTPTPPVIDGRLDDAVWELAPWTEEFVDIEGEARPVAPRYRTRARMLWDQHALYIAAEMEEPHVWGTLTERDAVLFHDNDFEVFIDPDGSNHLYGELEINALGTEWDLLLVRPYRDGGPAINGWDIAGLQTAVQIDGTLNDPSDIDRGWTVEIAIPWAALKELAGSRPSPPEPGDTWRINFSRVQWEHVIEDGRYVKTPVEGRGWIGEDNWVWSPQGLVAMHVPERWGFVTFVGGPGQAGTASAPSCAKDTAGSWGRRDRAPVLPDPRPLARPGAELLMPLYYAQRVFHQEHKRFAACLADLDALPASVRDELMPGERGLLSSGERGGSSTHGFDMEAGAQSFHATLHTAGGAVWSVDHEGRLKCEGSCP